MAQSSRNAALRGLACMVLGVAALAPLASKLALEGAAAAFAAYFVVFGFLLSAIESLFFFERPGPIRGADWLGGLLFGLAAGVAASLVLAPTEATGTLEHALDVLRSNRGRLDVAYSALSYMVAYCAIGSATYPFVRGFYEDPDNGLGLKVPSGPVVITLQLARGLLATLVLLPILVSVQDPSLSAWLALSLTLAVTCGIVPMLLMPEWPTRLRVVHGIEISVFSVAQGFAWWWFLVR